MRNNENQGARSHCRPLQPIMILHTLLHKSGNSCACSGRTATAPQLPCSPGLARPQKKWRIFLAFTLARAGTATQPPSQAAGWRARQCGRSKGGGKRGDAKRRRRRAGPGHAGMVKGLMPNV